MKVRRTRRSTTPVMLALEPRRLFSVTLSQSILSIVGTSGDDEITITVNANELNVSVNGVITPFRTEQVTYCTITSLEGNDTIIGSPFRDLIDAGPGNDNVDAKEGVDKVFGNDGDDFLVGGAQGDKLDGGNGKDRLNGNGGNDVMVGGADLDRLYGYDGNDFLDGGSSSDRLEGGAGVDTIYGQSGWDRIYSNDGESDHIFGGSGVDAATSDAADILASIEAPTIV